MTGRKADIIHRLYELQEKMEESEGYWKDALERYALMESEEYEEQYQTLYQEYWYIMMKEVEERWRKYVEGILGDGHFTEKIYVEELEMIMEADGKLVDEYQGYILRSGMDPFGALTYWIKAPDGGSVEESFDFVSDANAIVSFHNMVDRNEFY
ncbi:hypothetical protein MKC37_22865 [[Clostridium] innocuum]|nr:hypothetical protein [[Clostridium] innocuum]